MIIYNSLLINHGGGDIIMRLYTSYTRMRVCIYRLFLYINIQYRLVITLFYERSLLPVKLRERSRMNIHNRSRMNVH
jgi:hypothetical protein